MRTMPLLSTVLLAACAGGQAPRTYEEADPSKWFLNALDPHQSPVDLSHLNEKPAGKRGFVRARGNDLVYGDGTKARFWGANIQAYSLFTPSKERISQHAKRLSQLGFNLVRLHHHDSARWVDPSLILPGTNSRRINEKALDTYFFWISELKKNGIHVFVDLYTGRPFREGDGIPGFEELAKKNPGQDGVDARGFTHVNPRLQELLREFSRNLLTAPNPYTGLAIKDEPAVVGVLLTNENDVTFHFGNALLGDKGVPYHNKLFNEQVDRFSKQHGLDREKTGQTWLPGPSKLFLNDLEYQFSRDWTSYVKNLGVRVPIITGHMWGMPLFSLPALWAGDATDAHSYENGEWIDRDPRKAGNLLHSIGMAQYEGMPMFVTEWNTEDAAKARDPFTLPLYMAAIGAFQGWDAPMIYGYSQDGLGGGARDMWSSYTQPGVMGLMPAAALLYRRDVLPAKKTVLIRPTREQLFFEETAPNRSLALRTLLETHRFSFAMPEVRELQWLPGKPVTTPFDFGKDYLKPGATETVSDTGQIRRDWQKGVQAFDTPRSQAVQGWIGGSRVETKDAVFRIETRKASVALTSLDGKALRDATRILVTAVARVQHTPEGFRSEPVKGTIELQTSARQIRLSTLKADGSRGTGTIQKPEGGRVRFELPTDANSHWFLLER